MTYDSYPQGFIWPDEPSAAAPAATAPKGPRGLASAGRDELEKIEESSGIDGIAEHFGVTRQEVAKAMRRLRAGSFRSAPTVLAQLACN